ncbi:MAG: TetR/AcrR family transcriptional regulator [Alphaproteobacteria bacterium]|nr:TetR/AcrR family transcriptional regulator [Alphaproteobacteria bacterium]MDE2111082.1 TetR/AcrR family transcriptional regulator [Alphaproteobacteria bacterium]MDE2494782.1 TetR/AcrR family transcriptional regulator [Alphaproteobacteria bacterium]
MAEKDTVREQIIEAAKKRFSHFGYAKTTMAEVAADCSMSPGNLYRFFPGKLDIAEAIASAAHEEHLKELRKLIQAPGKSGRDRLRDFFFEELRHTYHMLEKNPRIHEMASVIACERPQYSNWMLANERKILVEIFDEAERRGEFRTHDKEFTAEMFQSATMKFHYPQLWSKLTLPKLERELDGVLKLLVDGLYAQAAHHNAGQAA